MTLTQLNNLREQCHGVGGFFAWAQLKDTDWKEEEILYHISKWLRKTHNIQIVIEPCNIDKTYDAFIYKDFFLERKVMNGDSFRFEKYEEALYSAILKAFEIINDISTNS